MTKLEALTIEYVRLLDKQSAVTKLPNQAGELENAMQAVHFSLAAIRDYVHRVYDNELKAELEKQEFIEVDGWGVPGQ